MQTIRTFGWTAAMLMTGLMTLYARPAQAQYRSGEVRSGVVRCESVDNHYARCDVPWRSVRLVRRESDAACEFNRSWGYRDGAVWVDRGCRGLFGPGARAGGWRPGPGWDREIRLHCGSTDYRQNFCRVDVGSRGHVRLLRQVSDTRCIEGRNWGWNRAGVWTDNGCRAQFVIDRRW